MWSWIYSETDSYISDFPLCFFSGTIDHESKTSSDLVFKTISVTLNQAEVKVKPPSYPLFPPPFFNAFPRIMFFKRPEHWWKQTLSKTVFKNGLFWKRIVFRTLRFKCDRWKRRPLKRVTKNNGKMDYFTIDSISVLGRFRAIDWWKCIKRKAFSFQEDWKYKILFT